MPSSYTTRPSVSSTYTVRPSIEGFQSYTWATAPDIWSAVSDTWDTYGSVSTGSVYTTRIIP